MGALCATVEVPGSRRDVSRAFMFQPQDAAFFETRGKAVVLYDYTLEMHKIE